MQLPQDVEKAYKSALLARQNAHAPYSGFKVGAALSLRGEVFAGCNVENASYGATMCAERAALFAAISQKGKGAVEFLVVVTGEPTATVPCGLCLQALAEFADDETPIYLGNENSVLKKQSLKDFLPQAFRVFAKDGR